MARLLPLAVLSLMGAVPALVVACGSDPPPAPQTASTTTTATASMAPVTSVSASASASASTASADGVPADSVGLGDIGTLGHTGPKAPSLRHGTTTVSGSGKLPVEVIDRLVRQQFGRFRLCYEKGLQSDPTLAGRVTVKFVIDAKGAVSTASDGGSDLKDTNTTGCIIRAYTNLTFPAPTGGTVTVSFPIILAPGI